MVFLHPAYGPGPTTDPKHGNELRDEDERSPESVREQHEDIIRDMPKEHGPRRGIGNPESKHTGTVKNNASEQVKMTQSWAQVVLVTPAADNSSATTPSSRSSLLRSSINPRSSASQRSNLCHKPPLWSTSVEPVDVQGTSHS